MPKPLPSIGDSLISENNSGKSAHLEETPASPATWLALSLSNSGDMVSLKDTNDTEVDFVAWENYLTGWSITAPTGTSIARSSTTDTDTVSDWILITNNGLPGQ